MRFTLEIQLDEDADAADIAPALHHAATTVWNHQKDVDFLKAGDSCVFLREKNGDIVGTWSVSD